MTTSRLHFARIALHAALVAGLAAHSAMAQQARLDSDCKPQLTLAQDRLYQQADEGTESLRRFIFIRRAILQVDVYEAAVWADSVRRARAACMKQVSQAR